MEEKVFDSFEKLELVFKDCYELCDPVAGYKLITEHRLNPAIPTTISFLCKTVKSFDTNLDKENFKLVWDKFSSHLYNGLLINGISKIEDNLVKKIRKMELMLCDDFDQYKKGQGLESFFENNYETFLKEARDKRSDWIKKTKNPKEHEIHSYYDIGDFNSEKEFQN